MVVSLHCRARPQPHRVALSNCDEQEAIQENWTWAPGSSATDNGRSCDGRAPWKGHAAGSRMFAMPQLRVARRSWCTASMPQVGAEGWDYLDDCPQQDDVHTKLTIGRLGSVRDEVLVTAFQARHVCGSCSWCPGSGVDRRLLARVACLLYTSDAADDLTRVDLGGGR